MMINRRRACGGKKAPSYKNLTFDIISDGTVIWGGNINTKTIQYRKNGGEWVSIVSGGGDASTINVVAGDVIEFIGNNSSYTRSQNYYARFQGTAIFDVSGNITSLLGGQDASMTESWAFNCFFAGAKVRNASGLVLPSNVTPHCYRGMFNECTSLILAPILPATTLAEYCYYQMFHRTRLKEAPELPALELVSNCYKQMFFECGSLNYVKALFLTTPSDTYTNSWLRLVSSTGTFVKNANAQWDVRGINGIPDNWTVQTI